MFIKYLVANFPRRHAKNFLTHPLEGVKNFWPTPRGGLKNFWPPPRFFKSLSRVPFREYPGPKQYMFLWENRLEIYACVSMTCKKCNNVIFLDSIVELARSAENFDFFWWKLSLQSCFAVQIDTGEKFLTHPLDGAKKFWPTPQGGLKNFWPPIFCDPPTPYLMNTPLFSCLCSKRM